jgi:predicted RNA binding protein YcfA (HicA-like mRNA interferase family)
MKPQPFRIVKSKLEKAGFSEVGQTGSHVKFAKTTDEGTRTATFRNIVKLRPVRCGAFCDRRV